MENFTSAYLFLIIVEIIQLNYFDKEGDCELLVSLQIFF